MQKAQVCLPCPLRHAAVKLFKVSGNHLPLPASWLLLVALRHQARLLILWLSLQIGNCVLRLLSLRMTGGQKPHALLVSFFCHFHELAGDKREFLQRGHDDWDGVFKRFMPIVLNPHQFFERLPGDAQIDKWYLATVDLVRGDL